MKVVCINNKPIHIDNIYNNSLPKLVEGEIYTVIKQSSTGTLLKEVKSSHPSGEYNPRRFREIDYEFGEKICNEILRSSKELENIEN